MAQTLILYSTVDGHTRTICERLEASLLRAGHAVSLRELSAASEPDLAAAQVVVIGASIRYGYHRPAVRQFMCRHQAVLQARICAFFSVNLVARKATKNSPATNPYLQKFIRKLGWQPALQAVFAGRIDYPCCHPVARQMIRAIMWLTGGPTDPHQSFEFTDWAEVDALGRALARSLAG